MIIIQSSNFKKAYKSFPEDIQKQFDKKFRLFVSNPRHSSLRVKKMSGTKDIFEARINDNYRWTFQFVENGIKLRHIGTHDILRHP